MSKEELTKQGYLGAGGLRGKRFGDFELLDLGSTTVATLQQVGLDFVPASTSFHCTVYKAPKRQAICKPDTVYLRRVGSSVRPVAVAEWKDVSKFRSDDDVRSAAEQAVFAALALGVRIAITTDGARSRYIDAEASAATGSLVEFDDARDFSPAVLSDLYLDETHVVRDPKPLAESVWQIVWHATKAEPKDCLLTFVEIFMLKFLSDNLPLSVLPADYRFDALLSSPEAFQEVKGVSQIEYYVNSIRPTIKQIFTERLVVSDPSVLDLFGLATIASTTSIINGFAFLKSSSTTTVASYNRTFCEILHEFQQFGTLTNIDPQFKLRLYETFLRKSARQQRLGQFFTPRNIVNGMIRMAQLNKLPDGAIVLDPAAGVGGFLLEPLLFSDALQGNIRFKDGRPHQRVKLVGVDVDEPTNLLAKANMLLHLAESVRDPDTTPEALNQALVNTFILMNENETLGALAQPPRSAVDLIVTNPPYVTQGSAIYKKELEHVKGQKNGVILSDYYAGGGLGVEALFLRYISGALKPGGRAFVIVPLGLLNRTAHRMKSELLKECNVILSIQLPRNAFFNTAQPTYILGVERRRTRAQSRPPVFCGIARTIGESLDYERVPTPKENDLAELSSLFIQWDGDDHSGKSAEVARPIRFDDSPIAKLVPASEFNPDERWDVVRHWTDAEHVELGERTEVVDRQEFIDLAAQSLRELLEELEQARSEIDQLTSGPTISMSLADAQTFQIKSGTRIRNVDLRENPGSVPVYSVFTRPDTIKGAISLQWLQERGVEPEKYPSVTIMATGASAVGMVFCREAHVVMTDDVVIVQPWSSEAEAEFEDSVDIDLSYPPTEIDLEYLAVALAQTIAQGGYLYEAKLYTRRVRQLRVEIPVTANGEPDLPRQRQIAEVSRRLDSIRARLQETGAWSRAVRLS